MDKEAAERYILEIPKFTKKNPLKHTREFLRRLGDPWEGMKVIHVAGTNGKGSVCAYLQSLLLAEGKRTGFFSSPHLVRMNERIRICGEEIGDTAFLRCFEEVKEVVEGMCADGLSHPTFFEFLFGMAMTAFRREGVEYCILETGLGGRLDSTNVVPRPELTVITSIGLDHMEYLGATVGEIAAEKAGIIKPRVPLVFDGNHPEARRVIEEAAKKAGAPCRSVSENAYEIRETGQKSIAFSLKEAYYGSTIWTLGTPAIYQAGNAAIALTAMEILTKGERPADVSRWQRALYETRWPGRMEEVLDGVYLDGAHNLPGVRAFAQTASRLLDRPKILLFSAAADKMHREMAECLCKEIDPDLVIVTRIEGGRGSDPETLRREFLAAGCRRAEAVEDPHEAYRRAADAKGKDGLLFCVGSLYLVGALKSRR